MKPWKYLAMLLVIPLLWGCLWGCSMKSKAATFEQAMEEGEAWANWMEKSGLAGVVTITSSGAPGISIRNDFLLDTSFAITATIQANTACARDPAPTGGGSALPPADAAFGIRVGF